MESIDQAEAKGRRYRLTPFLSPLGAWSYGVGTAIGWGSFVVTGNQYLLKAGPLGSVVGCAAGTLLMLVIAACYSYLMQRYPNSGGSYTYVRHVLGKDRGFLTGWFLTLTYMSVLWANATSLPLFARYFAGDPFKFGYLYTIFGYDVYLGEILLTSGTIMLVGLLCTLDKRIKQYAMVVLALVFTGGIGICFIVSLVRHFQAGPSMSPLLLPDVNALEQITDVALMTPWAFIGFESISHSTEEFSFSLKKIPNLMRTVVITTALLYIMVIVMSVTAYPYEYPNWFAYLSDLGNLSGIKALPPFYAASRAMGQVGVDLLTFSLLALVLTSLIGNLVALSRLFVNLGYDGILPESFASFNAKGTPEKAVLAVACVSALVPFVGRTAIGWIVDITTIGAVIVYGLVSSSARRAARAEGSKWIAAAGSIGTYVMVLFGFIVLLPNLFSAGSMAQETYFLLTIWSILGFAYLRVIMIHDETDSYGQSVMVWVVMLSFVLFSSTVWLQKTNISNAHATVDEISAHFREKGVGNDYATERYIEERLAALDAANLQSTLVSVGMFVVALGLAMSNYAFVRKRHDLNKLELGAVKETVGRDPLTGVKSKHAFVESEQDLNALVLGHKIQEFGVVVCDVNGLKFVNDTMGHKAGDEYIRMASRIVCAHFKRSPVYRIGGDEFAVILQGEDYKRREELLASFDQEVESNIGTTKAVVSAGISIFDPEHDTTFHQVFERADALMYQRKMQLKNMGAATRD